MYTHVLVMRSGITRALTFAIGDVGIRAGSHALQALVALVWDEPVA